MKKKEVELSVASAELPELVINNILSNSTGLVINDKTISIRGNSLKECLKCLYSLRRKKYIKR